MAGTQAAETWAAWLRAALDRTRMSQADLARTGVVASPSTISKWLRGEQAPSDVETIIATAHSLGEHDSIAALRAAGLHRVAEAIRREITTAHEDPAIARIRRSDFPSAIKKRMEDDYLRRRDDSIRFFELEFAAALNETRGVRQRTAPGQDETTGPASAAL